MRLTKSMKQAFVRRVMDDTEVINYQQQAYDLVESCIQEQMPEALRTVAQDKEMRKVLNNHYVEVEGFSYLSIAGARGLSVTPAVNKQIAQLHDMSVHQQKLREAAQDRLNVAVEGCTTLKALRERFPELAKYMPAEKVKEHPVPSVTGVLSALTAAGWPRPQQEAQS